MPTAPQTASIAPAPHTPIRVHRIEVWPKPGQLDPLGQSTLTEARHTLGDSVQAVRTARVYLIEAALTDDQLQRIAAELLSDPITQKFVIGTQPAADHAVIEVHYQPGVMDPVAQSTREAIIELLGTSPEIFPIEARTGFRYDFVLSPANPPPLEKIPGTLPGVRGVRGFAESALANTVIHEVYDQPYHPPEFPHAHEHAFHITQVPLLGLDDAGLMKLSRQGHLFLSLDEMRAIQKYFASLTPAPREPTDIELETLAQTWSEHCVHKTLKATVQYRQQSEVQSLELQRPLPGDWSNRPGHGLNPDGSLRIENLLKSTIAAATKKLMAEDPTGWCVSVFKDNAGIVRFDDDHAVCIKVETHNHPSAIEPYGGAATGIGGCIRDIMGTGLAAKPIANMDVFCVAPPPELSPAHTAETKGARPPLPRGVIPPQRILKQVVAGVRDYGNRMGIPTVNGAVWFHEDYLANPLVFAGCVGLIPLDKCFGNAQPGDRIIALGGRTGRDGIHGATFSSAELTDSHSQEFAHAVQIGNAITQKKTLDVILQARDFNRQASGGPAASGDNSGGGCLFNAITDCGAGGFSSAVGEMGSQLGARVTLETAPLKYQGLTYTEIWISEAQERMVLAVPPRNVEALRKLCDNEDVEMCDLGHFGESVNDEAQLVLTYHGNEVGRMSMHFLHDGLPMPTRQATWPPGSPTSGSSPGKTAGSASGLASPTNFKTTTQPDPTQTLLKLLTHPNIASKHWIIRQYDHEVQGGAVVKPLVGPCQDGPSDAAVIRPKLNSNRGVAVGCGLQPGLGEKFTAKAASTNTSTSTTGDPGTTSGGGGTSGGDSYWMALAAIDEAIRNVVCVGADPSRIALLDNFCWPGCDDPARFGALVRAAEACYDGALAYHAPFVSGKDSLNNQFTTEDGRLIAIPPTLLITALGIVPDVLKCRTMDAKSPSNRLIIIGATTPALGGSHYLDITHDNTRNADIPHVDLATNPQAARLVASLIADGLVASAHDCSDGGLLVAATEMAFAGRVGLNINLDGLPAAGPLNTTAACFAETPGRYLLEISSTHVQSVLERAHVVNVLASDIGAFVPEQRLTVSSSSKHIVDHALDDLRKAWLAPLDW